MTRLSWQAHVDWDEWNFPHFLLEVFQGEGFSVCRHSHDLDGSFVDCQLLDLLSCFPLVEEVDRHQVVIKELVALS